MKIVSMCSKVALGALTGLSLCVPATAAGVTVFVSTQGDDGNNGLSPATAYRTVAKGLGAAGAGGEVIVAPGQYVESPLTIDHAVTLSGSGTPPSGTGKAPPLPPISVLCQKQACITTTSGDRVLTVQSGSASRAPVVLSNLVVLGPNMGAVPGASSFGVIADEAPVTLNGVTIVAGTGGSGTAGAAGRTSGELGAVGGLGGTAWLSRVSIVPAEYTCYGGYGITGTNVAANGQVLAYGGVGGLIVNVSCPPGGAVDFQVQKPGYGGSPGGSGPPGTTGIPAPAGVGSFGRTQGLLAFSGVSGGTGRTGVPGAGGGGGGPGGTQAYQHVLCGYEQAGLNMGGAGGKGGNGGSPGLGGAGGAQGGGSFALTIANAIVGGSRLIIYGGQGGTGGVGGQGGPGAAGGSGEVGQPGYVSPLGCTIGQSNGGNGGPGGTGGAGGWGGGGAGGNGGPSVDVALIGTGALSAQVSLATSGGKGGKGNVGGKAGPSGATAASGRAGVQIARQTYPLISSPASLTSR